MHYVPTKTGYDLINFNYILQIMDAYLCQLASRHDRTVFVNSTIMTAIASNQDTVRGYLQEVRFNFMFNHRSSMNT